MVLQIVCSLVCSFSFASSFLLLRDFANPRFVPNAEECRIVLLDWQAKLWIPQGVGIKVPKLVSLHELRVMREWHAPTGRLPLEQVDVREYIAEKVFVPGPATLSGPAKHLLQLPVLLLRRCCSFVGSMVLFMAVAAFIRFVVVFVVVVVVIVVVVLTAADVFVLLMLLWLWCSCCHAVVAVVT